MARVLLHLGHLPAWPLGHSADLLSLAHKDSRNGLRPQSILSYSIPMPI